ncbi:hypothetical protein DPMN_100366 [Dreissena polymorpha]|uniref:Uncharacterized protein n=2 Tax=Dreissena polymorpha TaxID=45954 RepID=A0A9D4LGX3_DREPO|nr:hypothetical protein DPMN_100366 [Dreissena polymorpha]
MGKPRRPKMTNLEFDKSGNKLKNDKHILYANRSITGDMGIGNSHLLKTASLREMKGKEDHASENDAENEIYQDEEEEIEDEEDANSDDEKGVNKEFDNKFNKVYNPENQPNQNPVFKPGDFGDIHGLEFFTKPKLKYEEVKDEEAHKLISSQKQVKPTKSTSLTNGIFWTDFVESIVPKGQDYKDAHHLLHTVRRQKIMTLEKPKWNRCGRPQNGFLVLDDGTEMCARYRHPHDCFVYGESLSFFLSRLLHMDSVPAVVLARTNSTSKLWKAVNIRSLDWQENRTVALIQWVDNINNRGSKSYMPRLILEAFRTGKPVTGWEIEQLKDLYKNPYQLTDIVQWGTMIIFDYLTANYDRVASMQDAAEKESKPSILEESIRNLHKSLTDNKLWLIDNESGLLDAYTLLEPSNNSSRFFAFHDQMLKTMCVFQSSLVSSLEQLSKYTQPYVRLIEYAQSLEPLLQHLQNDPNFPLFTKLFNLRLKDVILWIRHCKTKYS